VAGVGGPHQATWSAVSVELVGRMMMTWAARTIVAATTAGRGYYWVDGLDGRDSVEGRRLQLTTAPRRSISCLRMTCPSSCDSNKATDNVSILGPGVERCVRAFQGPAGRRGLSGCSDGAAVQRMPGKTVSMSQGSKTGPGEPSGKIVVRSRKRVWESVHTKA
jgi:hypothetical protein